MTRKIEVFLGCEGASFAIASCIHRGMFIPGYEHPQAATAEGVIAAVLLAGLGLCLLLPRAKRTIALAAQGFALLGTCVGIFTIAIGVGPRTVPDVAYHVMIVIALLSGLTVAFKAPKRER